MGSFLGTSRTYNINQRFLVLFTLVMIIFLTGCGVKANGAPSQRPFSLSPTPVPLVTSTVKATPISLDLNHWKHFTFPVEVLRSDVHHIGEAEDGTMWFGGLHIYRYDGSNWLIFDPGNIPAFRGKVVESLAVEPGGTVWVGTEMNEVVSFDGTSWKSHTVEEGGYRQNVIVSILIRRNGELCAASVEGLSCKAGEKWVHHPFRIESEEKSPLYIFEPVLTASDEIWVPLNKGILYHYDGEKWESSKVSRWISSIASGKGGSLWISDADGIGKQDAEGNIVYEKVPANLLVSYPLVMKETNDGSLWLGTGGGYQLARYIDGAFTTVDGKIINNSKQYSFGTDDFPFYHVHSIFQAKDGSVWFGTVNGIFRYQ